MSEDSNKLTGAASLQWRGPWAVQLWLDEPDSDASVEVLKTSVAPAETFERSIEVGSGSRARILVVSDPQQKFRCRVEVADEGQGGGELAGASPRRWTGSTRFEVPLPAGPSRVTITIDTPRSGRVRVECHVADASTRRAPGVE